MKHIINFKETENYFQISLYDDETNEVLIKEVNKWKNYLKQL